MKTQAELLANATNDHDRELMKEELCKFNKIQNYSLIIGLVFFVLALLILLIGMILK